MLMHWIFHETIPNGILLLRMSQYPKLCKNIFVRIWQMLRFPRLHQIEGQFLRKIISENIKPLIILYFVD